MLLVEVVVGRDTRGDIVPRAAAFVRQIDKLPLPVESAPGFLVNRILAPYLMAAMRAVDEGIPTATVDEAALAFGMPMGPIELADTVGLDICLAVGKLLGGGGTPPACLLERLAAGKLGRKSGEGFYRWIDGKAQKDAAGTVPAGVAERLIEPFVAASKSALADGIVADADLVDAGAILEPDLRHSEAARSTTQTRLATGHETSRQRTHGFGNAACCVRAGARHQLAVPGRKPGRRRCNLV